MIQEFIDFAMKGNVFMLAIGFIMGTSFQKIVDSMVNDIIMPIIGKIMGSPDKFVNLTAAGVPVGKFIQAVINFLIIAFVLFLMVKGLNSVATAVVS